MRVLAWFVASVRIALVIFIGRYVRFVALSVIGSSTLLPWGVMDMSVGNATASMSGHTVVV
jgi:hypothetical protein